MMSETRRTPHGRILLGSLAAAGALLSLSACGFPVLPPGLGGELETTTPEPVETSAPETEVTDAPAGPEDTDVFDVYLGDCMNEMETNWDDSVSSVPKVDCSEPHDFEVYHVEDIAESGDYPGEDRVSEMSAAICEPAFETFVGVSYLDSELYYTPLFPTSDGWDYGDREVLCLIHELDAQTTGTLEGAGR
ncbi:septum formation family protein [Nocardiopsis algeriensis]|uniref:Septum formation-related domain-containing protein n=1 Tax=Nocardiopsis algeriensis TaxID=1478215 RepID=A0A841ITX4_9ACTN|nr:septum formation family protein [Nocardiopsis algeriensis]MBB6120706.1 hypothetical protein [Nocardiopsis algeriensis]